MDASLPARSKVIAVLSLALLLAAATAGCFGGKKAEALPGMDAAEAQALAEAHALAWQEDAVLLGLESLEFEANATITPLTGYPEPPRDDLLGDGRAPLWFAAYRSLLDPAGLLFLIGPDEQIIDLPSSRHPLEEAPEPLGTYTIGSARAAEIAEEDPDHAAIRDLPNGTLTMMLRPADPAWSTSTPEAQVLAQHPHWIITAWSTDSEDLVRVYIDATNGDLVDVPAATGIEWVAVHQHASFAIFVEGEQVHFDHPDYNASALGMPPAHLITTDGDPHGGSIIHMVGAFRDGDPDIPIRDFLEDLGIIYGGDFMALDNRSDHNSEQYLSGDGKLWRGYFSAVQEDGSRGAWTRHAIDPSGIRLTQGIQVLLSYDDPIAHPDGSDRIRAQQRSVPIPPPAEA